MENTYLHGILTCTPPHDSSEGGEGARIRQDSPAQSNKGDPQRSAGIACKIMQSDSGPETLSGPPRMGTPLAALARD